MTERADLTLESKLRLSDDVLFQELEGEAVLLDLRSGVYFGLDPVATRMWQLLGSCGNLADVVAAITDEFEVSHERCAADLLELLAQLEGKGLVAASPAEK